MCAKRRDLRFYRKLLIPTQDYFLLPDQYCLPVFTMASYRQQWLTYIVLHGQWSMGLQKMGYIYAVMKCFKNLRSLCFAHLYGATADIFWHQFSMYANLWI